MNKRWIFQIVIIVLLAACGSQTPVSEPIQSSSATATSTPMPTFSSMPIPASTETPTFTPKPTLEVKVQAEFYRLLNINGGCELPCFLGITPGESSIKEAKEILDDYSELGLIIDPVFKQDDLQMYSIQISTNIDVDLLVLIQLITRNDQIQEIKFSTDSSVAGSYAIFDNHLARFSLREIFQRHGIPDSIYIIPPDTSILFPAYAIDVIYEEENILITLSGLAKLNDRGQYSICPNIGEGDVGLSNFTLFESSSGKNIDSLSIIDLRIDVKSFPAEQVLRISVEEFYTNILMGDSSCFDIIDK